MIDEDDEDLDAWAADWRPARVWRLSPGNCLAVFMRDRGDGTWTVAPRWRWRWRLFRGGDEAHNRPWCVRLPLVGVICLNAARHLRTTPCTDLCDICRDDGDVPPRGDSLSLDSTRI